MFARVMGYRPLVLDLHIPHGPGPHPVVVWAHGGGWRGGTKSSGRTQLLAQQGYAIASVGYRLVGEAKYPTQLHDLKGAIRWLRANAESYRLDPKRVAGWGASAGAFLMNLLATTNGNAELEGDVGGNPDQSSAVGAVVDFFGLNDLVASNEERNAGTAIRMPGPPNEAGLLGYDPGERPEEAAKVSPFHHLSERTPPFLIFHGDIDRIVLPSHSQRLHDALTAAGVRSTFHVVPNAVHEDPLFWETDRIATIKKFLDSELR
jgi:acetyl esterase/lipase